MISFQVVSSLSTRTSDMLMICVVKYIMPFPFIKELRDLARKGLREDSISRTRYLKEDEVRIAQAVSEALNPPKKSRLMRARARKAAQKQKWMQKREARLDLQKLDVGKLQSPEFVRVEEAKEKALARQMEKPELVAL